MWLAISYFLEKAFLLMVFCCFSRQGFSLCSPGCPGTYYIDQTGLEFTEISLPLPHQMLGLKVQATYHTQLGMCLIVWCDFYLLHLCLLGQGLSLNLEITILSRLVGQPQG